MAREIDRPVDTFSVAFADRAFSELEYARQAARAIGADSHEIVIDDDDFFGALPRLIWHEDEPIAHPSSVPLHFVSALARQHVKVVLTGEGSDELLAGYGKYPRALLNWSAAASTSAGSRAPFARAVASSVVPRLPGRIGRHGATIVPRDAPAAGGHVPRQLRGHAAAAAARRCSHPSLTRGDPYAPSLEYFDRANGTSGMLDRLLYTDMKTYLVELLMKQDQMSMSVSIESRVPFLDHVLVEFAARLPASHEADGLHDQAHPARSRRWTRSRRAILTRRRWAFRFRSADWMQGPLERRGSRGAARSPHPRARPRSTPRRPSQLLDDHRRGSAPAATRSGRCSIWSSGIARSSTATASRRCPRPRMPPALARTGRVAGDVAPPHHVMH